MPGKNPASAAPSRNRMHERLTGPRTNIIAEAIAPQVTMMRAIHRRAPTRSRIRLLGSSSRK